MTHERQFDNNPNKEIPRPISEEDLEKQLAEVAATRSKFTIPPESATDPQASELETQAAQLEQTLHELAGCYEELPRQLKELPRHEPITLGFLEAIGLDQQTLAECRRLADDECYGWPTATPEQADYIRSPYASRDDFWRHLTQAPDRDMIDDVAMTKDPNNLWGRLRTAPIDDPDTPLGYSPTLEERIYNVTPCLRRADALCGDFMDVIRQLFSEISQHGGGHMPDLLAVAEQQYPELPVRDAVYCAYNLLRQLSMPDDPMKKQYIAHKAYGLPVTDQPKRQTLGRGYPAHHELIK